MAEEIKLSASLKDDVTKSLQKIERSLARLSKSFEKLGRVLRKINKELGVMAMSSERIAKAFNLQTQSMQASMRTMNQYRTGIGKTVAAEKRLAAAAEATQRAVTGTTNVQARGAASGVGRFGGARLAGATAFGNTLGNTVGGILTRAITKAFDIGAKMLMGPFQRLASMFAERVEDEMSDITSAGGMFAIDKKGKPEDRLFKDFAQARTMQRQLNAALARSAAALPGETAEYVQQAKQLTDTVMQIASTDRAAMLQHTGETDPRAAITQMLSKFTEQSVLLGMSSGKGGLPMGILLEQLVTSDQVNIQGMRNRYRQLLRNPTLTNALMDAQDEINAAGKQTTARLVAVIKALDVALPVEVVNAMRNSVEGIYQAIKSTFMDPEVGLFSLGRPIMDLKTGLEKTYQKFDDFGQMLQGETIELSVFELIRDSIAGFGLVAAELAGLIQYVYEPMQFAIDALEDARVAGQNMLLKFNEYSGFFKDAGLEDFRPRGALAALNNFLTEIEAQTPEVGDGIAKALTSGGGLTGIFEQLYKTLFASDAAKGLGDIVGQIVAGVVKIISDVLAFFAGKGKDSMQGLGAGLIEGFTKGGGLESMKTFVKDFIDVLFNSLLFVMKNVPLSGYVAGALAVAIPAIVSGIGAALAFALPGVLGGLFTTRLPGLIKGLKGEKPTTNLKYHPHSRTYEGTFGSMTPERAGAYFNSHTMGEKLRRFLGLENDNSFRSFVSAQPKPRSAGDALDVMPASGSKNLRSFFDDVTNPYPSKTAVGRLDKFAKAGTKFFKFVSKVLAPLLGFIRGFNQSDGNLGDKIVNGLANAISAGGGVAIGSAIGGIIGTTFGPVGTLIGTLIGGWIGSVIGDMDSVVAFFNGAIRGIGDVMSSWWTSFVSMVEPFVGIWEVVMDLGGQFWGWLKSVIPALEELETTTWWLDAGFKAVRWALSPITMLLDTIALAIQGFAYVIGQAARTILHWVNKIPGTNINLGALDKFIQEMDTAANDSLSRMQATNDGALSFAGGAPGETLRSDAAKPTSKSLSSTIRSDAAKPTSKSLSSNLVMPTSNSGKNVNVRDINVNVSGSTSGDPQETAELVAKEVLIALERSSYSELYV